MTVTEHHTRVEWCWHIRDPRGIRSIAWVFTREKWLQRWRLIDPVTRELGPWNDPQTLHLPMPESEDDAKTIAEQYACVREKR